MGTLDDAIREHLELKRRQGAGEDELRQAEAEAFGPGEEDEVPGASITAPAGEGDQLDKVFSREDSDDAPPTTVITPDEAPAPEAGEPEPAPEAVVEEVEVGETRAPADPEPEQSAPEPPGDQADAGDLLEAERANLTGHPTENYDVDAAIAEEQELDILSEGRLSEELDRALGEVDAGIPEGLGADLVEEPAARVVEETVEEVEVLEEVEVSEEAEVIDESPEPQEEQPTAEAEADEPGLASPLEETPDFLEDSPASDELWFEQGEPKDFDFGD